MNTKLQEIRNDAIERIKGMLEKYKLDELSLADFCSSTPIIQENFTDDNLTSTLDSISIENGQLIFYGSSCYDNCSLNATAASTDVLVETVELLENMEDDIKDYADECETGYVLDKSKETSDSDFSIEDIKSRMNNALIGYDQPQVNGLTEMEAANGLYDVLLDIQIHWKDITGGK